MKTITNFIENHSIGVGCLVVALVLALAFGIMCLEAWIVMLLWNWIAVSLFSLPTIGFWLAMGLCILCNILFKSRSTKIEKGA